MACKKKEQFVIVTEKDTFFEPREALGINPSKTPIFGMPSAFDSSLEVGPSWQYGTLQQFFESCLSLARDLDALVEIKKLLHRPDRELQDFAVNSLQKKKTGKEMRMNIQIGDYEVDSVILDLGSDVNILTKQAWQNMGETKLGWFPVQLRLANQDKVQPIDSVLNLVVDI